MLSSELVARFPFVPSARAFAREMGFASVGHEQLEAARVRAIDSVRHGLDSSFPTPPAPHLARESVSSYALGRILLRVIGSEYYWRHFAKGEAECARRFAEMENPGAFVQVLGDIFPTFASEPSGGFSLSLTDYLQSGRELNKQELSGGRIRLSRSGAIELFRNAAYARSRAEPKVALAEIPAAFKSAANELSETLPKPIEVKEYAGSFLSLPCIKSIVEGVGEGKRYYASMALAVACRKDGLPREKGLEVMQLFVNNCRKETHDFTMREATATLEWVYRRSNPIHNCNSLREHGIAPPECAYPSQYERARGRGIPAAVEKTE
ncbi:hypothetical protein HY095_00815 [Candidatus Micrarchaeota archaeon]|nr:hypothetical protein [Candidatus Micrarchaeota archaeon]